jgi:hypothetical protein
MHNPTVTDTNVTTPDASLDAMRQEAIVARNRTIGAIVGSVLMTCLVLFGVIFCLRRRAKRLRRVVDRTRAVSNATSYSAPSQVAEQQESGINTQGPYPLLDRSGVTEPDPALTVAAVQGRRNHLARYSQVSTCSSSRSIQFAVSESYRSTTNPHSLQNTLSVAPTDTDHTLTVDPFMDPVSPRSPISVKTPTDHTAAWRGTNLSNLIDAARGVKA